MPAGSITMILAQVRRGTGGADTGAGIVALLLSCCCPLLMFVVLVVPQISGMWKAFAKAGQPGWAALIPIYNVYVICKIAGKEDIRFLFWLIPIAGIYFAIVDTVDFCKAYGKEVGFAIGLILLPFIFWPILGFGSARYLGAPTGLRRRMRYVEEEEEDLPPRRRRRYEDEDEPPRRRRDEDEDEPPPRRRRP